MGPGSNRCPTMHGSVLSDCVPSLSSAAAEPGWATASIADRPQARVSAVTVRPDRATIVRLLQKSDGMPASDGARSGTTLRSLAAFAASCKPDHERVYFIP